MKKNTLSVWEYVFYHILGLASFMLQYRGTLFVTIRNTSLEHSLWVFSLSILLPGLLGFALTVRRHRRFLNLLVNLGLPFFGYTLYAYASRGSVPLLLWLALGAALFFCAVVLFFGLPELWRRRTARYACWLALRLRNILGVVLGGVLLASVLLSVLLRANIFVKSYHAPEVNLAYSTGYLDDILKRQEGFDRLYGRERSMQESLELLELIVSCELEHWGLPYEVSVGVRPLKERVLGEYDDSEKTITINESALERPDEELLLIVLHEMYHSVEHARVTAYSQVEPSLRGTLFFEYENVWAYEFENYTTGPEYAYQWVEQDANYYAATRQEDYMLVINHEYPSDD